MNLPAGFLCIEEIDEAINDPVGEWTTAKYIEMLEQIEALEGAERTVTLSDWARSRLWHPIGMMLEEWQGRLHREAYDQLQRDLATDSPAKQWYEADLKLGRDTICRLLGLEGTQEAFYAAFPFRTIWTQEDEPWIAGAVGCMPIGQPSRCLDWTHLDIREVILWNPKTGEGRIAGDAPREPHVVIPEPVVDDELVVFTDTGAYFAAWARRRLRYRAMKLHGLAENADGHLPGALILGSIEKASWPLDTAAALVPGAGTTRQALRDMVLRSAHLPRILEVGSGRG